MGVKGTIDNLSISAVDYFDDKSSQKKLKCIFSISIYKFKQGFSGFLI